MQITNHQNVPLVAAVWAVQDNYDYINHVPNYISVTTLLKPTQEIVLRKRITQDNAVPLDVSDLLATALGTSIHTAVEIAWKDHYKTALKVLGYDQETIDLVLINPKKEDIKANSIPVYLEQRSIKPLGGFNVGGKYDLVIEGRLHDVKSTSAYSWMYGSKTEDYQLQGSIYRWLNPEIITEDNIVIVNVFTDWSKSAARTNPKYPPKRVEEVVIPLLSIEETEKYILNKLQDIQQQSALENHELNPCTAKELWTKAPTFKYYADSTKTSGKSTKNFATEEEAMTYLHAKGKGTVIKTEVLPTRCDYCSVRHICIQRAKLFNNLEWEEENDSCL